MLHGVVPILFNCVLQGLKIRGINISKLFVYVQSSRRPLDLISNDISITNCYKPWDVCVIEIDA